MPLPSNPPATTTPPVFKTWSQNVVDTVTDHDSRIDALELGGASAFEIEDWTDLGNLGASETITGADNIVRRREGTLDDDTAITIALNANQQIQLGLAEDATGGWNPTWVGVDSWATSDRMAPDLSGAAANEFHRFLFEATASGTTFGYWITEPPPAGGGGSGPVSQAAAVATSETTTSTSYADLATTGPAVTLTVPASGEVWVELSATILSSGANAGRSAGFAISGASTVAASDTFSLYEELGANLGGQRGAGFLVTGLSAGSTTFTMKYRTTGGTLTAKNRHIRVTTLP